MLISIFTTRDFSTRARTTVSFWTPDGGSVNICRVVWDPQGPMSSREAVLEICRQVEAKLGRPEGAQHAREGSEHPQDG